MIRLSEIRFNPERFWRSIAVGAANECWLFTGRARCGTSQEYGVVTVRTTSGRRIVQCPHRIAYLTVHEVINDGEVVRHSCDVPLCCNPNHLIGGTQLENIRDSWDRRRARNGSIKLTLEQIREVQAMSESVNFTHVARQYGIHRRHVARIIRRETWSEDMITRAIESGDL